MSPRNVSFDDLSLGADESPYDTESEIKVVKRLNFQHTKLEIKFVRKAVSNIVKDERVIDISPADQDMTKADSDLESMPGDDIESLFWFEAEEFDHDDDIHFMHKEELSKDDEKAADNVIDELVDMAKSQNDDLNASNNTPSKSDHLGHLHKELNSLTSKLLSDTLKTILPELLKDSIKMVLTVEVPKLIIKPLNKELIALNTLENNRMENVKSVRKEFTVVHELLKYYITMLDMADVNVRELVDLIREIVIMIDTEPTSFKAAPEGEKKSTQEKRLKD
ncbi:hypothetical protein Tco_0841997 [Tanacetum coccineum]|uniref:Uncharacterized protein n=1 Tax=Tanacetum coccineum TaxID=301880 RepID=A0ABQ5AXZ8_9ASTR